MKDKKHVRHLKIKLNLDLEKNRKDIIEKTKKKSKKAIGESKHVESDLDNDNLVETIIRVVQVVFSGILILIGVWTIFFPFKTLEFVLLSETLYDAGKKSTEMVQLLGLICLSCAFIVPCCSYDKKAFYGLALSNVLLLALDFKNLFWEQIMHRNKFMDFVSMPIAIAGLITAIASYIVICVYESDGIFNEHVVRISPFRTFFSLATNCVLFLISLIPSVFLQFLLDSPNSPDVEVAGIVLQYAAVVLMIFSSVFQHCYIHRVGLIGVSIPLITMVVSQNSYLENPLFSVGTLLRAICTCLCLVIFEPDTLTKLVHKMKIYARPAEPKGEAASPIPKEHNLFSNLGGYLQKVLLTVDPSGN